MKLRLLFLTFLFSALSWGQIYQHDFGTTSITAHPYIVAPGIFDANLSNSSWVNSTGSWVSFAGSAGQAISLSNSFGTPTITLTFDVAPTYQVDVTSFSFWRRRSNTGAQNWSMTVNGINVGSGAVPTTGADTGNLVVASPVTGLSGTVTVVISLSGASGTGTFRLDDFTLNGSVYSGASTYSVTYDGNGNDSGSVPTDGNAYNSGDSVTVLGNTGSLGLTGYTFNGWNTAADGSGTSYVASDTFNITANTTLYAQWLNTSPPVITSSLTDTGIVGVAYTYDIVATNSPTSYSATGLPAGLSINTTTGQITGAVATAGVYNVTISATNAYGTDTETLVITITTGPCGSESFTNSNATASYSNGSFVGDNGVTWTYVQSRDENGDANGSGINGSALMLRRVADNSSVTSSTLTTGIQDFSVTLYKGFTGAGNRQVELFVNGVSQGTSTPFDDFLPHVFTVNNINISGNVIIEIRNITANQVIVDDIQWTCYNVNNEIDVLGNSVSIVDGDTTPSLTDDTDFGTTLVGVDVSHTFTITNAGPDDLSISGITITGVDAADFYVSIPPGTTVTSGGSTTFEITFNSATVGISNATVNIANNDSDENPYTFDITGEVITCTPTTSVSSISPASGPVGTVVTINGSGLTTATSVHFGAYSASFTIISDTVIEAIVPANATTGNIIIQDASACDLSYSSFTVIVQDNSTCDPTSNGITDLFISEVTDASSGSLSYIQIFNGTGVTVDMTDYSVLIRNNGSGTGDDIPLTGTLVSGGTFVLATSVGTACAVPGGDGTYADQNDVSSGVNNNDCIHLDKLGTIIDTWGVCDGSSWINALGLGSQGYDFKRNPTATPIPSTTFVSTDWTIVDFNSCSDNYDLINTYQGIRTPPSATTLGATYGASCTSASVSVTGTEAVAGGAPLTYQWYFSAPGDTGWTMVSNGGVYSGATTDTLNISDITGLEEYQYYCQVMEDTATCFIASAAVQIGGGASTTWNGTSWSNGVPNSGMLAIIDGDYDTAIDGSFSCCSLLVNATYTLDIQAVDYVEIQYNLTVNGTLNVWDDGSLVQVDDSGVNVGNINYERITTGAALDYVYWSSPVDGVNTPGTGYVFSWNPVLANPNAGWGYWVFSTNTSMASGVGYIMRDVFSRNFTGVPRNGVIQPSIARANYTGADFLGNNNVTITRFDDNWNLIGNPYPSAISALDFLTLNTNIEGAVRIWTHGTTPSTSISDPVYDDFVYNYTVNDYIVYNGTGTVSGPGGFNGFIAGGQSFMVNMNDGAAASETLTFNNSMRNIGHNNEQFYKQASSNKVAVDQEKHRIWLDLANTQNNSTRTLVGYVENATNDKDRLYDAITNAQSNEMSIYSIINNERMLIQGRVLPFDDQDKVQIGVKIPVPGVYTIGLSALDGLFAGSQDIYLEDKELNIIYDLKQMPYSFISNSGEFKNRFVLRYTNQLLNTNEVVDVNDITIATLQDGFTISSLYENIKSVTIHNVLGQILYQKQNVNSNNITISNLIKNNQALLVKITLDNNKEITKKVIY
ncbi:choice-of-anchor D domain-containing protein [Flavobacterium okayamense]|uniref:LTD domain-containing protein n=1 Tax=Flavobacterium okayamense TaxID=2830782 RepID=A0ABN6HT58_9FLAO|nr:choice-of-anchor D domain-containing protein [Flavobacterium okayamense]BCY27651.1 hypothetical protein KK2020170_05190 [Flavobacterium okayamense]